MALMPLKAGRVVKEGVNSGNQGGGTLIDSASRGRGGVVRGGQEKRRHGRDQLAHGGR
jgi:hypothetical protein